MKTIKILISTFLITLLFSSCYKNDNVIDDNDDTTPVVMTELQVPSDFDWKTQKTINVFVNLPASGEIQPLIIMNREGTKQYFRGFPEDNSRTINTKITIPAFLNEVRLIYNGTKGPNMVIVENNFLDYNYNSQTKSTKSNLNCDLSNFTTYSKGGWGSKAHGNNVGVLRDAHFDDVYPTDFIIGDPNNKTITLNSSKDVENFLPDGGRPKVLSKSWINPKKKDKLGNMADQIVAARLNVDYNAAGFLGVNPTYTLGQLVFIAGPFANTSVNDFLAMAEIALGGGGLNGYTAVEYATTAENIINSFHEGINNNILTCPDNNNPDDEPYIEVSSICSNNHDIIFIINNSGDDDMSAQLEYRVYKNGSIIETANYTLGVNETLEITFSGYNTDVFKIELDTPRGEEIYNEITDCGIDEPTNNTNEQLEGTLAYEDLWPGKGDYDFNDLVIDYDFVITKNSQEVVQSITATFKIKAFGASYHNGFGFTLPNVVPSDIAFVSGYDIENTALFNLAGNGVEAGQSKATFILYDDSYRIMPSTGGIGVNTELAYDYVEPVTMTMEITFASNNITYSELNIGEFNPFIVVNGERGLEVHLPNYEPSDLFDASYFGMYEDASDSEAGKYFVTENNLPWAINIAEGFDWVIEKQDITGAYNNFAEWAESGGINYPDWYKDFNGYRNGNLIYPTQVVR